MKNIYALSAFLILGCLNNNEIAGQPLLFNNASNNEYQSPHEISELADSASRTWKTFSVLFLGTIDYGRAIYMPCWPESSSFGYSGGGTPVNGYGFGIKIDFRPVRNVSFFFDITAHSWKFQVAEEGSRSESDWVFEQTGYNSRYTGTFDRDVYFFMNSTIARIGARYIFPINEKVEPWIGLGYGFGTWTGNFLTSDKKSTYGFDSGNASSLSYLAGIDFRVNSAGSEKSGFLLSLFIDVGSPVAAPIEVNDLFYDGWTWKNTAGEHIILPYRFGLAIGF